MSTREGSRRTRSLLPCFKNMARRAPSSFMTVGRGGFLRQLRAMLLASNADPRALAIAIEELGDECVYCGANGEVVELQGDHLAAQCNGGAARAGNIVPSCGPCNSDRNNAPWKDYVRRRAQAVRPSPRSEEQVQAQIARIERYCAKYLADQVDGSLRARVTTLEWQVYRDTQLILYALSDSICATLGHEKPTDVRFDAAACLFRDLQSLAARHLREPGRANEQGE